MPTPDPAMPDLTTLADALLPAVLEAARVQLTHRTEGVVVERKGDDSPVTVADRRSEEILAAALAVIAPTIAVIAEEASSAGRMPALGDAFFLVDPLDGTRDYATGSDEFTINVALVRAGIPVFGLVYAPALSEFYATVGSGHATRAVAARLEPRSSARGLSELATTTLTARRADPTAVVALVSRSHLTPETQAYLARFTLAETRRASSSIKFCRIAAGDGDLYPRLGETSEWDTAAGHAILAAAGGQVTRIDGTPLSYGGRDRGFVNPAFVAWGAGPLPLRT